MQPLLNNPGMQRAMEIFLGEHAGVLATGLTRLITGLDQHQSWMLGVQLQRPALCHAPRRLQQISETGGG
jgi:hypothetical protein